MNRLMAFVVGFIWVALLGSEKAFPDFFPHGEPLQIDSSLRETLTKAAEGTSSLSKFHAVVEDALRNNEYMKVAQIGEYLHGFYDLEKRKVLIPDFAAAIKANVSKIPEENRLVVLRSLGRAAFLYEDANILPSADLSGVADAMMIGVKSESKDVRTEAYFWLMLITGVDPANAGRLRKWAQDEMKALDKALHGQPWPSPEAIGLEGIDRMAQFPKYPDLPNGFRDDELPRTDGKSVSELASMIAAADNPVPDVLRPGKMARYLRQKLALRTSPSELDLVLKYELDRNDAGLLGITLRSCFGPKVAADDASRTLARQFIVSNLLEFADQSDRTKTIVDALKGFSSFIRPVFDAKSSQQIYTAVTASWPMANSESRVRVYRVLLLLSIFGEGVSEKVADFATQADAYERSASYADENARKHTLAFLKSNLPPKEPKKLPDE
jgi:hypothetical protein